MQREIDTLVEQRDRAMDALMKGTDAVRKARTKIERLMRQRDEAKTELEFAQNRVEYLKARCEEKE